MGYENGRINGQLHRLPYGRHTDSWADYGRYAYQDHTDHANAAHADEGAPHQDTPHGDWTNIHHADQAENILTIKDIPIDLIRTIRITKM